MSCHPYLQIHQSHPCIWHSLNKDIEGKPRYQNNHLFPLFQHILGGIGIPYQPCPLLRVPRSTLYNWRVRYHNHNTNRRDNQCKCLVHRFRNYTQQDKHKSFQLYHWHQRLSQNNWQNHHRDDTDRQVCLGIDRSHQFRKTQNCIDKCDPRDRQVHPPYPHRLQIHHMEN
eukprot:Lithocolla_globosa_v1_NODE_512_length_3866_cov_4.159013.p2 type:complete len:170 gc:universal NODE_512_length_3866_cov_4.159013:1642-1133(-)